MTFLIKMQACVTAEKIIASERSRLSLRWYLTQAIGALATTNRDDYGTSHCPAVWMRNSGLACVCACANSDAPKPKKRCRTSVMQSTPPLHVTVKFSCLLLPPYLAQQHCTTPLERHTSQRAGWLPSAALWHDLSNHLASLG